MNRTIALISALLVLSACGGRGHMLNSAKSTPAPVTVKVQRAGFLPDSLSTGFVGTVNSSQTALLTAPSSGTLVSLPVREGDRVKKGQKVGVISSQTVSSAYDAAASRLAQAEDGWARIQKVYKSGTVTEVDYLRVKTQLDEARAAEAAARSARDRCTLKAPFNGVVDKVYQTQGVEATIAEPIVRIVGLESLEIRFSLPEKEFSAHLAGEKVTVEIPAINFSGQGVLLSKGVSASPLSHSYQCTVSAPSGVKGLMPGMVCKVFLSRGNSNRIVVPTSAVMTDMKGRFVWTATGGVVDKKHITVGGYQGQGIVVADGLDEDDLVIIEGSRKVSTGMSVNIRE